MAVKSYTKSKATKLSTNFNSNEFDCKGKGCCKTTKIDTKLVQYLQKIRTHFGKSVVINSAYRCPVHNAATKNASKNSLHTKGQAADIVVSGVKPTEVAKYAESIGIKGIGLYDTFVHIDTRTNKFFWFGHGQEPRTTFGGAAPKKYSGTFPDIKVVYYTKNSKGKNVKSTRNYLKKGDNGTNVVHLQKFLNWYGNYGLTVDGDFGAKTDKAVKDFQADMKITSDGKFGTTSLHKAKIVKK